MDIGLFVSFAGIAVAALAGVLGVWMERDPDSPRFWGLVFSALILASSLVEAVHTARAEVVKKRMDGKMATALVAMSELAAHGKNPALDQFVGAELAMQARANPEVVDRMEQQIEKAGGDPSVVSKRAAEGQRVSAGLPAAKPAAGERPRLASEKPASQSRTKTTSDDSATKSLAGGEPTLSDLKDVKKPSDATKLAGDAAKQTSKKAVDDTKQAANDAKKAAEDKAADAARKKEEEAKKAADAAKKKKEEEAKKAAEDAKKKTSDKAKDALKGLGK